MAEASTVTTKPGLALAASWDPALALLGLLFGAQSLTYPFGRDQGLYFYVAREWVLRGAVPYRDVLDHKTPGIYLVHALAVLLFGEKQWGIRVLELGCIVALGLFAGSLTARRGVRPLPGIRGAAVLSASVLYFGVFDFWNTAQSEIWYGTLGLGAVWAATRIEREPRALLAAGAFSGAAMVMKPPAVWFVLVAASMLALRLRAGLSGAALRRKAAVSAGLFAAGVAAVALPIFVYFAACHALGDLVDVVGGANSYYVRHERGGVETPGEVLERTAEFFGYYRPLSTVLLVALVLGIVLGIRWRDAELRDRHVLAAVLCVAGYGAMAMQAKFYLLHWGSVIAPGALVGANVAADLVLLARWKKKEALSLPAFVLVLAGLYSATGGAFDMWWGSNRAAAVWLRGGSREAFVAHFALPPIAFFYADSEWAGNWLREHSAPDDYVAVRGFQPEIYAVARRRYPGRFFWTTFLVNPARAYRREQWLEEDRRAFEANPPRYVVTLVDVHEGLDSSEHYVPLGYVERARRNRFAILERAPK